MILTIVTSTGIGSITITDGIYEDGQFLYAVISGKSVILEGNLLRLVTPDAQAVYVKFERLEETISDKGPSEAKTRS